MVIIANAIHSIFPIIQKRKAQNLTSCRPINIAPKIEKVRANVSSSNCVPQAFSFLYNPQWQFPVDV